MLRCLHDQAFFTVIDGHGGRAAVDYVAENLGKNIVKALENIEDSKHGDNQLQQAIHGGYLVTDEGFLSKVSNSPGADNAFESFNHPFEKTKLF